MPPTPIRKRAVPLAPNERRSRIRFSVVVNLEYTLLKAGQVEYRGYGRMVNISSSGVLFEATDIQAGKFPDDIERVRIKMDWPLMLNDGCPLTLELFGRLVRRDARMLAVEIDHYDFHTARVPFRGILCN